MLSSHGHLEAASFDHMRFVPPGARPLDEQRPFSQLVSSCSALTPQEEAAPIAIIDHSFERQKPDRPDPAPDPVAFDCIMVTPRYEDTA